MNKRLKLNIQLSDTTVIVCYGRKEYSRAMLEYTEESDYISKDGVVSRLKFNSNNKPIYIVGFTKYSKKKGISLLGLKGLVVHELSHLVTMLMEDSNIRDDEYRSMLLQMLYTDVISWMDGIIFKQK